jgi:hypothetical protein
MSLKPTRTPQTPSTTPVVPRKEIRRMPFNLTRFLDVTASITVVSLALFLGGATAVLGL